VSDIAHPAPELSIIVVSYGTRALTLACLESVERETRDLAHEMLVVDNASPDGSAAAIAARFSGIRLWAEKTNLGFAAACNLAAAAAQGKYLLFLNPDAEVKDRAIEHLVAFAKRRPEAGIWGGRTLYADGTLNPMSCYRRETLWSLFCRASGLATLFRRSPLFHAHTYAGWIRDSEREVDIVTGGFLLIAREAWQRLGGFAPEFFMYGEDVDLCLRARALGYRPRFTPEATIVHHGGGARKDDATKLVQVLTARTLIIRKHFPRGTQGLALALLAFVPWVGRFSGTLFPRSTWRQVWQRRGQWRTGQY
jgi:hypothetical protein